MIKNRLSLVIVMIVLLGVISFGAYAALMDTQSTSISGVVGEIAYTPTTVPTDMFTETAIVTPTEIEVATPTVVTETSVPPTLEPTLTPTETPIPTETVIETDTLDVVP